jgi:hypothetical protein
MASAPKKTDPASERRDSPRVPMTFLVRILEEGSPYEEHDGDLALGGIHWKTKQAPVGKGVEVRFRLPGVPKEIRAPGEIIKLSNQGKDVGLHVRFTELDVLDELAIAKFLDDAERSER